MSLNINSEKIIDPNLIRNQKSNGLNGESMGMGPHPHGKQFQQIAAATQRKTEAIFLSSIQRYE